MVLLQDKTFQKLKHDKSLSADAESVEPFKPSWIFFNEMEMNLS